MTTGYWEEVLELRLGDDQVRRARVRAQLLSGRRVRRGLPDVVSAVVGIQAQDPGGAALSIRARSSGSVVADIQTALTVSREIVLLWSLRGTRHYHHVADVRWLLALVGPVFGRPGRRAEQLGIAGKVGDTAVRVVRDALGSRGPLTREEIKDLLASHGVDPTGQAPIHVLHRAGLEGILGIVPGEDGEERYVLLDDWIPPVEPLDRALATAELARRYLTAYGPATPADFAAWSGLGSKIAKQA